MQYRALLAAINDYGHPRNNLPSCVADLQYVEQLLRQTLGVPSHKVRVLVDKQVTKDTLEQGLQWLTGDTAGDERLLFFFSGHGFQLPGSDGSVEEALVLSGKNEFFIDNALVEASQAANPGTLTVLLDCCFGGGNDKNFLPTGEFGAFVSTKRWSPPDDYIEQQSEALSKGEAIQVASYKPFGGSTVRTKSAPSIIFSEAGLTRWPTAIDEGGQASINGALLAACLEDETASASTARTEGLSAFTYALKLIVGRQGLDLTLQQLRDGTDETLKRLGFRQTPTLKIGTGPIDRDSRFLTLERKASRPVEWISERSNVMTDKFLETLVPTIVERCLAELTKKGYAPAANGADKFFPGFETIVPVLVNRVIDELTKKGYAPASGASSKFFPGSDIIVRELINIGIRELTKQYQPTNTGDSKSVGGAEIERIIREGLGGGVRGGTKDFQPANAGVDKFPGADIIVREVIERIVREATKDFQPTGTGGDKFFPGAEIIIPIVVDRVVRQIAG